MLPTPVVGHFHRMLLIVGEVRPGGEVHVVVEVDVQRLEVALRGVFLALVGEFLGDGTQVSGQDALEARIPGGGELAVGVLQDAVHVAFEAGDQFAVHVAVGAVVETRHDFVGHDAVVTEDIHQVAEGAALGEVQGTIHADVLLGFVSVGVGDDEHLG